MVEKIERLETFPGEHIRIAAAAAVDRANGRGGPVGFSFNEIEIVVHPGETADAIEAGFMQRSEQRATEWRASPAGQEAAEKSAALLAIAQADHDACMTELPQVVAAETSMVEWLCRFAEAADHRGIVGADFPAVIHALETAGYRRNMATGWPQTAYDDPTTMARYLAGQAIDCLCRGLPPHQMTLVFAERYRATLATPTPELPDDAHG